MLFFGHRPSKNFSNGVGYQIEERDRLGAGVYRVLLAREFIAELVLAFVG